MDFYFLFQDNLLPIFLTAGIGYLMAAWMKVDLRPISQVAFTVFSPCMVFQLIVESELSQGEFLRMFLFAGLCMCLMGVVGWIAARMLRLPRPMAAALVLVVFLPNTGNYGLSATLFAFGEDALAHASIFFITAGIFSYSMGVLVASLGRMSWKNTLVTLTKVPALWAVLLAFLFAGMHWTLPGPATKAVNQLSAATIPTFLVILGMNLQGIRWMKNLRLLAVASGLRLLGGMAVAVLLAHLLGLDGAARQAGILEAAMPSAVITIILATEYEIAPDFVAAAVLVSTVLSPLVLTPLLGWLGA